MRSRLALVILVCAAALTARPAEACSCIGNQPCEAAWRVDAVFVAQVVRIERQSTHVRAHLLPIETFRGPSGIVSIDTGLGGGDCGYAFQPGEVYLIYARGSASAGYSTGICNRTRPISQADDDLEYLRTTARTPSSHGLLYGTAWRADPSYGEASQRQRHPGIRVTVIGTGIWEERDTDENGRYEVALPPGEYEVKVQAPAGLYASVLPSRVELRDPRGCAEANISLNSDGRIRGRVVDPSGQPVAGVPLELVRRMPYGFTRVASPVASGADGAYEFTRVPPGSFLVAFDTLRADPTRRTSTQRLFLPGTLDPETADVVALRPTERVRIPDLVFPDGTGAVRLTGQVRTADGEVVEGARVYLRIAPPTALFFFSPPVVSDANGEFSLIVPGDADYHATVELTNDPKRTRSVQLTVRPALGDRFIDFLIPGSRNE